MTRLRTFLVIALLGLLVPASLASADSLREHTISVGHVGVGASADGDPSLLIPIRYPIQLAGRPVKTRVVVLDRGRRIVRSWTLHNRLNSGHARKPEKRDSFVFVHRIDIGGGLASRLRPATRIYVLSPNRIDFDGDGERDVGAAGAALRSPSLAPDRTCSSIRRLWLSPGRTISVPLPACGDLYRWVVAEQPERGHARIRGGRLLYSAPTAFRGSAEIELGARRPTALPHPAATVRAVAGVTVGSVAPDVRVRALGDSVTAGFGYFSNATPMKLGQLLGCRPPEKGYDDACSSNSLVTSNKGAKVEYAPDFGLANDVSWAAQWANEHGLTDYKNYAISGSEPADWAPGGQFYETTSDIEAEDPDYILMTVGANPLLSEMLFGLDNMGCAVEADVLGGYRECVERAFAQVKLQANLKALYSDLVKFTDARIFLMQYHLSVPSTALAYSATQIAEMGKLLNREIAAVAAEVSPQRLQVVTPPHFDVGIDISPVYPSSYSCSRLGYEVDGPSVQSTPTQDELEVLHPLSFCSGPAGGGAPWVISGDTGIHPSVAGYEQMASQVPPPG